MCSAFTLDKFDQSRLSVSGTTVADTPTNVQDISALQIRLEGTEAGGAACGSGALLSIDQRLHHARELATVIMTSWAWATLFRDLLEPAFITGLRPSKRSYHLA